MESLLRTPSAGRVIKKINEINPNLSVLEIAEIVRNSIELRDGHTDEFVGAEIINEAKALALALNTVGPLR